MKLKLRDPLTLHCEAALQYSRSPVVKEIDMRMSLKLRSKHLQESALLRANLTLPLATCLQSV